MNRVRLGQVMLPWMLLAAASACRGKDRETGRPESTVAAQPESTAAEQPASGALSWDQSLGRTVVVALPGLPNALALYPVAGGPAPALEGRAVTLFWRGGEIGAGVLQPAVTAEVADSCPVARLVSIGGRAPSTGTWTVAFESGRAEALALDSLNALSGADSARRIRLVAQLASTAPGAGATRFAAIPYTVVSARRVTAGAKEFLIGQAFRRMNQEDAPLEDRVLLIAERDTASGPDGGAFHVVHIQESTGGEDNVDDFEVLAVVRLVPSGTLTAVIARDHATSTSYEVVQRTPSGAWRITWMSTPISC
jgi:hypothetical protein